MQPAHPLPCLQNLSTDPSSDRVKSKNQAIRSDPTVQITRLCIILDGETNSRFLYPVPKISGSRLYGDQLSKLIFFFVIFLIISKWTTHNNSLWATAAAFGVTFSSAYQSVSQRCIIWSSLTFQWQPRCTVRNCNSWRAAGLGAPLVVETFKGIIT